MEKWETTKKGNIWKRTQKKSNHTAKIKKTQQLMKQKQTKEIEQQLCRLTQLSVSQAEQRVNRGPLDPRAQRSPGTKDPNRKRNTNRGLRSKAKIEERKAKRNKEKHKQTRKQERLKAIFLTRHVFTNTYGMLNHIIFLSF